MAGASSSRFDHLSKFAFAGLKQKLAEGGYVSGKDLAAALRRFGDRVLDPTVREYIAQHLEGAIAPPKGRRPLPPIDRRLRDMLVRGCYRRAQAWLHGRGIRRAEDGGWRQIKGADFWQGTASEIAARMVARRWLSGVESYRTVQNIAASQE